ncbi:hypothetical protein OAU55_00200 [Candidatus Pelagibacter sp.]|nr:hypothetical protein [Candidatus Pelagibacter sp.]
MNYTTLKTNIQNFLEDDSTELTASIDQIIAQAEDMIFQRLPNLPCFRHSTKIHGLSDSSLTAGTSNYIVNGARMIRQVAILNSSNDLVYLNHKIDSYLRDYWPNETTQGTPRMYSTKTSLRFEGSSDIDGMVITLAPTPNANPFSTYRVDFIGFSALNKLSNSNENTWIGDNAENLLLSACLYEASAFLKAGETLALYKTQFDEALQLFVQEMQRDYAAEYNGGL